MDLRVSRKETMRQPLGLVEVLVDNVFDVYPRFDSIDPNLITDVEILDSDSAELLDRAMFAVVKQRGIDPLEPEDGIQWSESLTGEIPGPIILQQIINAVQAEGPGVRVEPVITPMGTSFTLSLTNPAAAGII